MNESYILQKLTSYIEWADSSIDVIEAMLDKAMEIEGFLDGVANNTTFKNSHAIATDAHEFSTRSRKLLERVTELRKELTDTPTKADKIGL